MSTFLRHSVRAARGASRSRLFASSSVAQKDLVQELYLREIKGYKAPPQAKDAHVGAVKNYTAPEAPKPPSVPANLASELSAYDAAEPSKDAAEPAKVAAGAEAAEVGQGAEAFLSFLEADPPKHEEAHH